MTAWPRLGAKLGSVYRARKPCSVEAEVANEEPGDTSGDDLPDIEPDIAETPVERSPQPNDLHPTASGARADCRAGQAGTVSPRGAPARRRAGRQRTWRRSGRRDQAFTGKRHGRQRLNRQRYVDRSNVGNAKGGFVHTLRASERTEPQQPQSTTRPHSTENSSREGQASGGDSLPEATEPVRAAPRVTVVSQQNVPAPMASTTLVLVDSIAGSTLLGGSNTAPS